MSYSLFGLMLQFPSIIPLFCVPFFVCRDGGVVLPHHPSPNSKKRCHVPVLGSSVWFLMLKRKVKSQFIETGGQKLSHQIQLNFLYIIIKLYLHQLKLIPSMTNGNYLEFIQAGLDRNQQNPKHNPAVGLRIYSFF